MTTQQSSTLVETVSINYEDFHESFLTCSTCLSLYDGSEHTPKLLPCSHTVCVSCLGRIVANSSVDVNTLRCPICRDSITLPQGGVSAFPPSFIVNQLLDLMARQRREIVPKCSTHMSQELLFCESCDTIFCIMCAGSEHGGTHTVIPFSIAIKRMSEILLYKAHLCVQNLNNAQENVSTELNKLETNAAQATAAINQSFDALQSLISKRKTDLLNSISAICSHKKKVFNEQLQLIETEKSRVETDCEGLESEMEVRHITKKIADLNDRLDATAVLAEPRENAFIQYYWQEHMRQLTQIDAFTLFGKVKISNTYPALCHAVIGPAYTFLESKVKVHTIDYHGRLRTTGGDPIEISLIDSNGDECDLHLHDNDDGTYAMTFMPNTLGAYKLSITIFGRHIKGSPYELEVSPHISPISKVGGKGNGLLDFSQPTCITRDPCGDLYVLDTGNNRIKVLAEDGSFITHITSSGLDKQGCTGIAVTPARTIMAVNWRTKLITEMDREGSVVKQFTSPELQHPTSIAVNGKSDVLIADNTAECIFIFDNTGRLVKRIPNESDSQTVSYKLSYVSGLALTPDDDIIAVDNRVNVFSSCGTFQRVLSGGFGVGSKQGSGQYTGVTVDTHGNILATRTDKGRSFIEVHRLKENLVFFIDSHNDKLKRPSGLVTTNDFKVHVCDLGNHSLKTYRYK